MTIQLTQDQRDYQEAIRAFVDKEIIPVARDMEHSDEYPTAIVEHMKEMGLFGMTIPEEFGGLGVDMTTFSIVFEELSRGWMGVAGILGSHSMACFVIAKHGTPEQKAKYLPELAQLPRLLMVTITLCADPKLGLQMPVTPIRFPS